MIPFKEIRASMPAVKDCAYLMSAAASPMHPRAVEAAMNFAKELYEYGDKHWERYCARLDAIRIDVAAFLNCSPDEIAFVGSSSMAMNIFAMILKRQGLSGRVLTMQTEFPSTSLPWIHQGFELDFVGAERGGYPLALIERAWTKQHRVLLSSQVQYSTGFRQDLKALRAFCDSKNAFLAVNSTQCLGAFAIDASQADFLCASVHKWLMAGYGLSIVKISKKFLGDLPLHGWLSEIDPWPMQNKAVHPAKLAKAIELGCSPLHQIYCAGAVIKWIQELGGVEKLSERILSIRVYAISEFKKAGIELLYEFEPNFASGILMLRTSKDAKEVEEALAKKEIFVSARGGALRVAIHYFNDESDIQKLIAGIKSGL